MNLQVPPLRAGCHATVVVPARNEEARLRSCLECLRRQTLSPLHYDIILLLNNCTDGSASVARSFREAHPDLALHCVVLTLPHEDANVGTARRLLMEEASVRLPESGAILSTDADTMVAGDWVESNLRELAFGADLVGGEIMLDADEHRRLTSRVRSKYDEDASYQSACTHLESLLDPDPCDPWPRHHYHFGASLACSNRLYRKVGGLPKVDSLEDVALVGAAVHADARLRHKPGRPG